MSESGRPYLRLIAHDKSIVDKHIDRAGYLFRSDAHGVIRDLEDPHRRNCVTIHLPILPFVLCLPQFKEYTSS